MRTNSPLLVFLLFVGLISAASVPSKRAEPDIRPPPLNTSQDLELVVNSDETKSIIAKSKKKDLNRQTEVQLNANKSTNILTNNNTAFTLPTNDKSVQHIANVTIENSNIDHNNITVVDDKINQKSGAKRRGFIVFGSLTAFAFAYFVYKIYIRKKHRGDNSLSFEPDHQQFKYGILTTNESGDNLEMSNIPLTAETDDEDELEIFDLEGKDHFIKNGKNDTNISERLLAKDDVEILDLELPGVKSTSHVNNELNDDDLLDLDDAIDEILNRPGLQNKFSNKEKSSEDDHLFDAL